MYNQKQVQLTLKQLVSILAVEDVEYRLLGSVVTAAINDKVHRNIGDIDFILDKNKKEVVFKSLSKLGYTRADGMFAFSRKYMALETLIHPELVSIGYFWGTWKDDGSFYMGNSLFNTTIESKGVKQTKYRLDGVDFMGIPQSAMATGILSSKNNKKRQKEIALLKAKQITPLKNNYIHFRALGIPFDWAYHGLMGLFNVLGAFRQKLGLPFDPWRSKIH